MFALAPILWGAGIGALSSMAFGKDPIKGAVLGGATGGLLDKIPAGSFNLSTGSIPDVASGFAAGSNPAAFLAPTGQEIGMANAFNLATNAPLNVASSAVPTTGSIIGEIGGANLVGAGLPQSVTSMQDFAASQMYGANNTMLNEPMLGGINALDSADYAKIASTPAQSTSSIFDEIRPYLNVRDLTGAAQVASQYQPRPLPTPQSGQVTRGQAPQGTDVMALLQTIRQPERRRITLL